MSSKIKQGDNSIAIVGNDLLLDVEQGNGGYYIITKDEPINNKKADEKEEMFDPNKEHVFKTKLRIHLPIIEKEE